VGIGITTEYNERYGYLAVISVTPGSPADQAHIKIGNMIASVNSINISQYTPEQLNELMRGFDEAENEEDKYFTLRLLNSQGGKAEVRLKCELIYAEPVYCSMIEDTDIGYMLIKNFDDSSAASFKTIMEELKRMGALSVIIDVRDNVSGKPGELSEILDYLLPKGDMFLLRDRSGKETTYSSGNSSVSTPIAVIVNENTSCAAEVFASVMQQNGYKIVGRRTAAQAHSQTIVELTDGSAVRLSRYEYLTPDKKSMADLGGVSPDKVSYQIEDSDMDVQLEAALDILE
jgi:carboxyl-terminal processing protease